MRYNFYMKMAIALFIISFIATMAYNFSLYSDCIADGQKPYVCRALVNGSSVVIDQR